MQPNIVSYHSCPLAPPLVHSGDKQYVVTLYNVGGTTKCANSNMKKLYF